MVLAHHLILTPYGWWLPNDPRGSMSQTIRNDVVAELGVIHYGRKKVQPIRQDIRKFHETARMKLQHTLLPFANRDQKAIAEAFAITISKAGYTCYACAILPDHAHICLRKHRDLAEAMSERLLQQSKQLMQERQLRPADHPVWGGPGWKVFLDSTDDIWRTIRYIEENPVKAGLRKQSYSFVTPYDNWSFHKARNRKR